ncbi:MAG TPA: beta-ketoacyl-ACP synthase II [Gammaproteobacteria bacterium]|nr:beta-ketoacyl-ACP synthase II [Gammaproteobacteria bacterium]
MRRVVVTGLGPVTPIGTGADAYHEAQLEGRSGIRRITRFDASHLSVQIAGEVDIEVGDRLSPREIKRTDRFVQLAMIAADLALEDSGLDPDRVDPTRIGTVIGSGGIGGAATWEKQTRVFVEKGSRRLSPLFFPMILANMTSAQVAMRHNLQGPSSTVVTACATGSDAIGTAARMIQAGEADLMLGGGTEATVVELAIGGFAVMRALSTRNDEPQRASRPFTAGRDGFVMSEGAGVLVLEEYEHARARGARIYGEVTGYGRSTDAWHITDPHPEGRGAAAAMHAALADAGIEPGQIGYINAHATSTRVGDAAETLAIKHVFGEHARRIPVSSTKSMIGHLAGAAGAVEAIAALQALHSGILPPTINQDDPDPELDLDYVPNTAREQQVEHALSDSFGFGGQNAVLVFSRLR